MNHSRTKHKCTTSQPFQMLRWVLAFSLLFALIGVQQSNAQNESGKRIISKTAFARNWYDSTKHIYHLHVPILRMLPPLTSNMPYDVMRAYVHLDSIARFNIDGDLVQFSSAWTAKPELLKKMLSRYYTAMDYDPLRYQQYEYETALKSSQFKSSLGGLTRYLPAALLDAASDPNERYALTSVIVPDYVLRIKITAIDSMPTGYPANDPIGAYTFNVTAQVLDTIKGQTFHPSASSAAPGSMSVSIHPSINFQYYPGAYFPGDVYRKLKEDETFLRDRKNFSMRVGQEAVVFLSFINQKFDSVSDAFELSVEPRASYNALPIIDGQVRDVNRIWSSQTMINYMDWRQRFLVIRDKILSGTY